MIRVTVMAFDYVLASALTGISDLLSMTGVLWNTLQDQPHDRKFDVRIASDGQKPIYTQNNIYISPHCAIQDIEESDVVLIPSIAGDIDQTLQQNPLIIEKLKELYGRSRVMGSNSTGAFFLAEAGLLDGKSATTHWGAEKLFREKYPLVNLKPDQLITHDGGILCDGGGLSWFDLGLHIIELFCDHETAVGAAKAFVIDTGRPSQLTYSPLISKKHHNDQSVLAIQDWMEVHYSGEISMEQLAQQFSLSTRTLIRKFKASLGITPSAYLQEVRIDAARKYLVQTKKTVDEITSAVGYEDVSSFTKLFKRKTGLSPINYRARYQANVHEKFK